MPQGRVYSHYAHGELSITSWLWNIISFNVECPRERVCTHCAPGEFSITTYHHQWTPYCSMYSTSILCLDCHDLIWAHHVYNAIHCHPLIMPLVPHSIVYLVRGATACELDINNLKEHKTGRDILTKSVTTVHPYCQDNLFKTYC